MWFVFPQIAGLGHSSTAIFYALADCREAEAYAGHPVLGPRLLDCTAAMMRWAGRRSAADVLGEVDAPKFASSMTLFEASAADAAPFAAALDAFNGGKRDPLTLARL